MKSFYHRASALALAAGLWLCLAAPSLHAQVSLSLNGSSQYVQVPANTNLTPTNITLEAWVNIPAAGLLTIASRGNGDTANTTDYIFQIGDADYGNGTFVTLFGGGAWGISTSKVPTNAWTHVAVTYDGTNKLFYINGALGGTTNRPGPLYSGDSATSPLYLGRQGTVCDCNFFNGKISEVRIWNYVRSASQIQADMNFSSGSQPGLLAYYHLDEGGGTNAYDASGNGNTGTLENGASWSNSGPLLISVVTNTADSGPGTLRSAIASAANGQFITFALNLSGATIYLLSTLTNNTSLTIDASALPGGIQINLVGHYQVYVASGVTDMLNSLTIESGYSDTGGGIDNNGTLTLNECTLSQNRADVYGGGIYNNGTATLNECLLVGNNGGYGELNAGGGGIFNSQHGAVTLNECTVSGSSAYSILDPMYLENGGGIYNMGALTLNDCTVCNDYCSGGGAGIFNSSGGTATLNECTLSENFDGYTGGIANQGTVSLNECTVSENRGSICGGIYNGDGTLSLTNTIVAGNYGGDIYNNNTLTYGGSNLVENVTNVGTISGPAPLDAAPDLASLGNYGGPTYAYTMPPLPGSPAIGAGSVAANTFTNDQRGYARTQNGLIDIGAVEFAPVSPIVTNLADAGAGSLRQAIVFSTNGSTINFAPNLSGGAITLFNTLTINTSLTIDASALPGGIQINGNGAVQIFNVASGTTDVLNSLIIANGSAGDGNGGGILNGDGTVTLEQCTLSGNSAGGDGGGIVNGGGTLDVTNSIVAGNNATNSGGDISLAGGALTYGGSNLVENVYNNDGTINGPVPLDAAPDLASLGNYGGPTETMPPLPGSPAIGAGSVGANTFTNDQRGYARTQNGLIDIGAVELPAVQPFSATPTNGLAPLTVQFNATNADSDGSAIVRWNWSFGDGNASVVQNPTDIYSTGGVFSPGLIVTNSLGLALGVSGPAIAVYLPTLTDISLSGNNLTLSGTNGFSGVTYTLLTSTNLALPLSQWTSLVTNTCNANGAFSLTLTNVLNPPVPGQFYLLRVP
ncbi:MAG TPA: choice-of-anchor Q domain-containing protein [Candidatus Acidoferrales bacterium]|nr:choice-of-anchor Q domain-containing protein [Candidatus Acidoferrales bacterium]